MTPGPDAFARDKAVLVSMVPEPRGLSAVLLPTFPSTVRAVVDFFFFKDFHSFRRQAFFLLLLAVVEKPQRPLCPHGIVLSHTAPASRTRDGIRSDSRAGRAEITEHKEEKSRCWSIEEKNFQPAAWRINHWGPVVVSSSHNCDSGSNKVVSKSARAVLKLSHRA